MIPLTPRQTEIAGLVARGLSAPEIARRIHRSPETVQVHIRQAAERLPGDGRPRVKLTIWIFKLQSGSDNAA